LLKKWISVLTALILMLMLTAWAEPLREGSRGEEVQQVQQRLMDLGYLRGTADGIYGGKTAAAVELFQFFARMEQTGVVDEATLAAMNAENARALIPALSAGDDGESVVRLQEMLIRYGFMSGTADGEYGAKTAAAVKAFQKHLISQGLEGEGALLIAATGEATSLTQEYLFSASYSTFVQELAEGDEADDVQRIETRLAALGYLDGAPDKMYDEYTTAVVSAFQANSGLEATGMIDRTTVDMLFSENAPESDHFITHDVARGDRGEAVRAVQQALQQHGVMEGVDDGVYGSEMEDALVRMHALMAEAGDPRAALLESRETVSAEAQDMLAGEDLFYFAGVVTEGSDEEAIRRVQRRLYSLYYLNCGSVDGDFGKMTKAALEKFQTNNGLEPTGIADEATQRVLFSADAIYDCTPYKLVVSTEEQRVYVYQLNEAGEYEYLKDFICSTGYYNPTPPGIFINTGRINYWHHFGDFDCYAQYSYQINGKILFHSYLYDAPRLDAVDELSVDLLGSKASHGCVRLTPEDAGWIFENCARGTVVVVY